MARVQSSLLRSPVQEHTSSGTEFTGRLVSLIVSPPVRAHRHATSMRAPRMLTGSSRALAVFLLGFLRTHPKWVCPVWTGWPICSGHFSRPGTPISPAASSCCLVVTKGSQGPTRCLYCHGKMGASGGLSLQSSDTEQRGRDLFQISWKLTLPFSAQAVGSSGDQACRKSSIFCPAYLMECSRSLDSLTGHL